MAKKIYWDSCCFIGLIQREHGRFAALRTIYDEAEKGNLVIYTSTLTISEVCKVRCDEGAGKPRSAMPEEGDAYLNRFFDNDFFDIIELSPAIAIRARSLFRSHAKIGITNDAVHLATAITENVDEMHTYDGNDLLELSNRVQRLDGEPLMISVPTEVQRTMFTDERPSKAT